MWLSFILFILCLQLIGFPNARYEEPEVIASLVSYLARPEAHFITGESEDKSCDIHPCCRCDNGWGDRSNDHRGWRFSFRLIWIIALNTFESGARLGERSCGPWPYKNCTDVIFLALIFSHSVYDRYRIDSTLRRTLAFIVLFVQIHNALVLSLAWSRLNKFQCNGGNNEVCSRKRMKGDLPYNNWSNERN